MTKAEIMWKILNPSTANNERKLVNKLRYNAFADALEIYETVSHTAGRKALLTAEYKKEYCYRWPEERQ